MKKINIIFIGECIVIVLLLAVLGILLQNNSNNSLAKEIQAERIEEIDAVLETTESNVTVVGSSTSGVVNVSDFVKFTSDNSYVSGNNSVDSISDNQAMTVSENMIRMGKTLYGRNIVVFGDSIWNDARGEDGISEYIQEETGATVYNCAIGGTTAALVEGENSMKNWSSNCFNGMIYVARGLVPAERVLGDNPVVLDIIKQVDFTEMDYVIVSYGLNDFFCDVSIYPKQYYEITNYVGALRNGINKLKENYPHLKIIVVSPTYTKMYEGERTFEIGSYVEVARGVAADMEVEFLDMFHVLGNDAESRMKHLEDGVHLSAEGREIYSDAVIRFLKNLEAKKAE